MYREFFLELYNKRKEYTSCIPQFKNSVKEEKYNYLRGFSLFLKEEFFFFFNLRKQTLKAELKQLIEAIQYASATLKFRENKKLDYTLINRQ